MRLCEAKDNTSKVFNSRHHIITMRGMISALVDQINAAIDAIGALGISLNDQVNNIELLMDSFEVITSGSNSTVLALRRSNMRDGVKKAIKDFEKVCVVKLQSGLFHYFIASKAHTANMEFQIRTNAKAFGDSARLRVKPDGEQREKPACCRRQI